MEKGVNLFKIIILIVIGSFILNAVYIVYNSRSVTGFFIKNDIYEFYSSLPLDSKIFLVFQLILLLSIAAYLGYKGLMKNKDKKVSLMENKASDTELDSLYELLKQKREISLESVSRSFKINESLAMDWAKTLEIGNLAVIDYPRFGGPVIRLKN